MPPKHISPQILLPRLKNSRGGLQHEQVSSFCVVGLEQVMFYVFNYWKLASAESNVANMFITIYTYFPVEGFLEYCSLPPQQSLSQQSAHPQYPTLCPVPWCLTWLVPCGCLLWDIYGEAAELPSPSMRMAISRKSNYFIGTPFLIAFYHSCLRIPRGRSAIQTLIVCDPLK